MRWVKTKTGEDAPDRVPESIRDCYPGFAYLVWLLRPGLATKQLQEVKKWAESLTGTNCGWQEYEMAQFVLSKISDANPRERRRH